MDKPYGYVRADGKGLFIYGDHQFTNNYNHDLVPVYTHPKEWVGLTDEEIDYIYTGIRAVHHDVDSDVLCRAIEAKLKEKNTRQDGECKYCTHGCPACDARRQSNVLP